MNKAKGVMKKIVLTVAAGTSRSGNPQRLDLVWDVEGELTQVREEGYRGPLPRKEYVDLGRIAVTPSEYHNFRRLGRERGIYEDA